MKTYCKNIEINYDFVSKAYDKWLKAGSGRINEWRVYKEYGCPDNLIREIVGEVRSRKLRLEPIRYTYRLDSGKIRKIGQESVKQQILNYTAIEAMESFLHARIGYFQVASVKGKGSLFGARKIQSWLKKDYYWVHLDVTNCYGSIGHPELNTILNKYIRNNDVLYICEMLMKSYGKGLNIGSYFSLKMAQLLFSFVYHWIEGLYYYRRGKRHKAIAKQIWYADDIYLFCTNKSMFRQIIKDLEKFLFNIAGVRIKSWKICRTDCNEFIDFAGFVCHKNAITIRDNTYLKIRKRYNDFNKCPSSRRARSVCSYWGILKNTNSLRARRKNNFDVIFNKARLMV